ncbi:MAG: ABC transporter ATP-binding protein [Candidatus Thermoplasmatota archaeon]|nr:ABC transporter ATP-binding protein [Candidatus Thermoplasmatota archaeon]
MVLDVTDLETGYGDLKIVHGVSFQVPKANLTVMVGPNGAGKSTVLKAVAGLVSPWTGKVAVQGVDTTDVPAHEKVHHGVAVVPQYDNVFPRLTVREHLDVAIGASGRGSIEGALSYVPQLEELMDRRAGRLSGGQRQLVALGRALVTEPQVLLLDEPTAGIQPNTARDILDHIREIAHQGMAVLMVEQNAKVALERADQGLVLDTGEIAFQGPGPELLENPQVGRLYLGKGGAPTPSDEPQAQRDGEEEEEEGDR